MCRFKFFGLHRHALLSSGGCLRRISGNRNHVDLDRALGIGVTFTNLLHALQAALFLKTLITMGGECSRFTVLPKASRAGHADQLLLLGLAAALGPPAVTPGIPR